MEALIIVMASSASIAHHMASALAGIILAGILGVLVGWVWPGMGLPGFVVFLLSWGLETINRIHFERRHPELIGSPGWKYVKLRYKPLELGDGEYEVTLIEFVRGQVVMITFGIPLALFVAGITGILSPGTRWPVFFIVFGVWAAIAFAGILWAVQKR